MGLSCSAPGTAALHPPCAPPVLPHTHSSQAPYPDPVLCHSQAKPLGKNSQVRAASAASTGPSAKSAVPALPQKARAVAAQVAKWEEDSESCSEEESDSEGEALRTAALIQVRPLLSGSSLRLSAGSPIPLRSPCLLTLSVSLSLRLCTKPHFGCSPLSLCVLLQAKSSGKVLQVRPASGPTQGPPQKAGPAATQVKTQRSKEDSESSEEESDSEDEAPTAKTPAQVAAPAGGAAPQGAVGEDGSGAPALSGWGL